MGEINPNYNLMIKISQFDVKLIDKMPWWVDRHLLEISLY